MRKVSGKNSEIYGYIKVFGKTIKSTGKKRKVSGKNSGIYGNIKKFGKTIKSSGKVRKVSGKNSEIYGYIRDSGKNREKVTDIRGTCADIPGIIQNPAESNVKNPKTAK